MNTLFNSALRQSTALRKDLDALADAQSPSPALLGQISASLTSFNRTIDDYNKLAKQEIVADKQTKAFERVKTFRAELADYREMFNRLKSESEERQTVHARTELLGRRPHHASTPENPYANNAQSSDPANSVFRPSASVTSAPNPYSSAPNYGGGANGANWTQEEQRGNHAFREKSFMSSTNAQLDEFLERGRAVLGDLGDQREMLKGTQKKLYSVANTLGISGDTIRMVERRARQDKWIFWTGVVVFFGFCWLVIHYLR